MDYKELYKRAFSTVRETYPCSDHETALKNVMERAKNMKKDDNVRQVKFTEIPVTYTEPKKSTKVLHAVAGVAGAAAVLTGAVFGLKFLNEHGGLREGGSDEIRAGYNEDTKTMSDVMESKDILDAVGDVIEFEDMTATIEQVLYDGHILRVIYRVDSYDEDYYGDGPAGSRMEIWEKEKKSGKWLATQGGGNTYDKFLNKDNHRNVAALHIELGNGESTEITFRHDVRPINDEEIAVSSLQCFGTYTLYGVNSADHSYSFNEKITVTGDVLSSSMTAFAEIEQLSISPLGLKISSTHNFFDDMVFNVDLKYNDGTVTKLVDRMNGKSKLTDSVLEDISYISFDDSNQKGTFTLIDSMLYDPIDVNNIAAVFINGTEISLNVYTGMDIEAAKELLMKKGIGYEVSEEENADIPVGCVIRTEPEIGLLEEAPDKVTVYVSAKKNILDAANDVIEFDGLTATIEKVDFDGTFLRVYYTPSGYKGENKEGSRRFQSAMMTLGTPETEAYDPRRVCSYVGAYDEESGLNCTAMFVDLDEGDTLDINFRYSEETGHYTLTGIGKSENTCVYDINNNGLRWIRLSPSGVVIASSEKYYTHDPQCSFSVICKDGSSRRLYDDSIMYGGAANECSGGPIEEHFGLESGDIVTTFLSIDPDPIDVRNIVAVEINGTVIPLSTE
ncbi:MAG: PASTA domain-containing protein [Ruminiclostridium sp.]|nr:PASTA domain-containing protein [Ruminiclostridium sp.]